MELTKIELEAVEAAAAEVTDGLMHELNELQLAGIGGGFADVGLA